MKNCFIILIFSFAFKAYSQDIDQVKKYIKQENLQEAEKLMEEIRLKKFSSYNKKDKIIFFATQATIFIKKEKYPEAIDNLLMAKGLNKNDSIQYQELYNFTFGALFQSIGAYSSAIEYMKKCLKQTDDKILKFEAANGIGSMFYELKQLDSAMYYFNLHLDESLKIDNEIYYASGKNNIGLTFFHMNEIRKSLPYFYKANEIMEKNKDIDEDFYYSIQENLGRCFYKLNNYKKAIEILVPIHKYNLRTKKYLKSTFYQNLLVNVYLKMDKIEEAKSIKKSIEVDYSKMNTDSKYYFLCLTHEIAIAENDYKKAQEIFEKIKDIQIINSNEKKEALNHSNIVIAEYLISEAGIKLALESKLKRNSQRALKLQKNENYFIRIVSGTVFLLAIIGLFIIYHNYKNKQKKAFIENEFLLLEEEKLKLKIGVQEKNLTEFAIDYTKKKELYLEIITQLNFLSSLKESEIKQEIKTILTQLKTRQNLDKHVENLNENSELIMLHFKNKLIQLHPNLNKNEVELCALIKLNLSNKEISNFRNISYDSVKSLKNRLKRKLLVDSADSMSDYLAKIN